jgi:hypothetical protein
MKSLRLLIFTIVSVFFSTSASSSTNLTLQTGIDWLNLSLKTPLNKDDIKRTVYDINDYTEFLSTSITMERENFFMGGKFIGSGKSSSNPQNTLLSGNETPSYINQSATYNYDEYDVFLGTKWNKFLIRLGYLKNTTNIDEKLENNPSFNTGRFDYLQIKSKSIGPHVNVAYNFDITKNSNFLISSDIRFLKRDDNIKYDINIGQPGTPLSNLKLHYNYKDFFESSFMLETVYSYEFSKNMQIALILDYLYSKYNGKTKLVDQTTNYDEVNVETKNLSKRMSIGIQYTF